MDIQVLLAVAIRASIVYAFLFVVVRMMGKRRLGLHSAFDLVVAILLANLASEAIFGSVTLLHGLFAAAVVAGWHLTGAYLGYRHARLQRWFSIEPRIMVRDGELLRRALDDEHLSEAEFWSLLRQQGIETMADVKLAILEPSGRLSIVRQDWAREAQKADLRALAERGDV